MRQLVFVGSSQDDLREFPEQARTEAGHALWLAEQGRKHESAVPLKGFGGASVLEIRIAEDGDAYRAVYTVALADAVYVLHCFQKKSKTGIVTSQRDIDLIKQRLKEATARSSGREA
jgi:phage-related protein